MFKMGDTEMVVDTVLRSAQRDHNFRAVGLETDKGSIRWLANLLRGLFATWKRTAPKTMLGGRKHLPTPDGISIMVTDRLPA